MGKRKKELTEKQKAAVEKRRAKAAEKRKIKAEAKAKAEAEAVASSEEVKPTDVPEATPETDETKPDLPSSEPKPIAKPSMVQCANCLKMGPPDEMFSCHHCGKRGCKKCGWYPPKNNVCPNCGTVQRVLRGTR